MTERSLDERIQTQIDLQAERTTGAQLRQEARERLLAVHSDMEPRQLQRWFELFDQEEQEPIPNLSAGAAALVMMQVRENYKSGRPSYYAAD